MGFYDHFVVSGVVHKIGKDGMEKYKNMLKYKYNFIHAAFLGVDLIRDVVI